ncbi:MAG: pilus assembly protein [Propionibacteriaceae bacterium]|nr:pilus assembly protein [Propionibacteriaceae bacterium]
MSRLWSWPTRPDRWGRSRSTVPPRPAPTPSSSGGPDRTVGRWRRPPRYDRSSRRDRRESGAVSIEMVVIFPVVLLVSLVAVQAGLWMYARSLCLAAAQEGVLVGAAIDSNQVEAEQATLEFIAQAAPRFAGAALVSVTRSSDQISVTVRAEIPAVLPGLLNRVDQTASLPLEMYT